jgi:methyltransferase
MLLAIAVQRVVELRVAKRNEAWARSEGAVEYGAAHYPAFFVLHGAWLVGWLAEAWSAGPTLDPRWPAWLGLFAAAQGLRYWAIHTLGRRWNTRILVFPGRPAIADGPYRWLRHPNYVAVVLELWSVPAMFGAWTTAAVATVANLVLLLAVRIPAEEAALRRAAPGEDGDERR